MGLQWASPLEIAGLYEQSGQHDEAVKWYRSVEARWQTADALEKVSGEGDLSDGARECIRTFTRQELPRLIAEGEQKAREAKGRKEREIRR